MKKRVLLSLLTISLTARAAFTTPATDEMSQKSQQSDPSFLEGAAVCTGVAYATYSGLELFANYRKPSSDPSRLSPETKRHHENGVIVGVSFIILGMTRTLFPLFKTDSNEII